MTTSADTTARPRRVYLDDVEWLLDAGEIADSIAARLGVTRNSVYEACRRNGRHDLLTRLIKPTETTAYVAVSPGGGR